MQPAPVVRGVSSAKGVWVQQVQAGAVQRRLTPAACMKLTEGLLCQVREHRDACQEAGGHWNHVHGHGSLWRGGGRQNGERNAMLISLSSAVKGEPP